MNNANPKQIIRHYAVTLQTSQQHYGKVNRLRDTYFVFLKLLQSYRKHFEDFWLYPELISSKHATFTPVHFHGVISVATPEQYLSLAQFGREFNKTWTKCNFDCQQVKDENWVTYCEKDKDFTPLMTMPHLIIDNTTIKALGKWSRPKETGIAKQIKNIAKA